MSALCFLSTHTYRVLFDCNLNRAQIKLMYMHPAVENTYNSEPEPTIVRFAGKWTQSCHPSEKNRDSQTERVHRFRTTGRRPISAAASNRSRDRCCHLTMWSEMFFRCAYTCIRWMALVDERTEFDGKTEPDVTTTRCSYRSPESRRPARNRAHNRIAQFRRHDDYSFWSAAAWLKNRTNLGELSMWHVSNAIAAHSKATGRHSDWDTIFLIIMESILQSIVSLSFISISVGSAVFFFYFDKEAVDGSIVRTANKSFLRFLATRNQVCNRTELWHSFECPDCLIWVRCGRSIEDIALLAPKRLSNCDTDCWPSHNNTFLHLCVQIQLKLLIHQLPLSLNRV